MAAKPYDVYVLAVPQVPGVTRARMAAYIKEAVRDWGGQFHPDDGSENSDPLGPPCVLMSRGAVRIISEARPGAKAYHPCNRIEFERRARRADTKD